MKNKIKYYERYGIYADSTIVFKIFRLDSNGNLKEERTGKHVFGSNLYFEYDSLGRMVTSIYESDTYSRYEISYESYPEQKLLLQNFNDGLRNLYSNHIRYNYDLSRILRETEIEFDSKDTLADFTYDYNRDNITVVRNHGVPIIEYTYEGSQLKEIRRIMKSTIDYFSLTTGLLDSSIFNDHEKNVTTYYRYFK